MSYYIIETRWGPVKSPIASPEITRFNRQQDFVGMWQKNMGRGAAQYATGIGKTFIALIIHQLMRKHNPNHQTLVVVDTDQLKEQWITITRKLELDGIVIGIVNTVCKQMDIVNETYNLLVLDEADRYFANTTFGKVVTKNKIKFVLALSAEFSKENMPFMQLFNVPILDTVTIHEARRNGWVSDYLEFNYMMDLDPNMMRDMTKLDQAIAKGFGMFGAYDIYKINPKDPKIRKQLEQDAFSYNMPVEAFLGQMANLKRMVQKRKTFLYSAEGKIPVAVEIASNVPMKSIIFTQDIPLAQKISAQLELKGVNVLLYHSKLVKGIKEIVKRNIKENRFDIIVAVQALDRGMDVPDIGLGINVSYTSKSRQKTQRTGRAVRFNEEIDVKAFVNLCYRGTKEEGWLKSAQKGKVNARVVTRVEELLKLINNVPN